MVKQLSENIALVIGPKCSAIYSFIDGKVYSVNEQGTQIITKYLNKLLIVRNKR